MSTDIQDLGRGPEIVGTRVTVYNLLQSFLDPTMTEDEICRIYGLSACQVAAARAYVLSNPETVLAEHLRIEERLAAGNAPAVREQAERAKATFHSFKLWLARQCENQEVEMATAKPVRVPTFREWLAEQNGR